jgi:5'-nucleotidase
MYNRRKFIAQSALAAGSVLLGKSALHAAALAAAPVEHLTILHTNDTHSRLDPFPMDGSRNEGLGGVARRAKLIQEIRAEAEHVLLLDAGDIFQGTPYFNIYNGEPEIKALTAMGYDAVTIGNHDFDGGIENLAAKMQAHGRFETIVCNYDFSGTPMENIAVPYKIFRKGGLKIGVLGVGIELDGLVPANLYGTTRYLDPVEKANETAALLRSKNCDMVICLSHLGYRYSSNKISDIKMAAATSNIDLIIGGHTHDFLDKPEIVRNKNGAEVMINQVGWAGIKLGRLDYSFERGKRGRVVQANSLLVTKKTIE